MKISMILGAVILGVGILFLVVRSRMVAPQKASANDIPSILTSLGASKSTPAFAVLAFVPPGSTDGEAVNLQYSVENQTIGFDWVLIGPRNVADKQAVSDFAGKHGVTLSEREMNGVRYLRAEGGNLSDLGVMLIRDFYKIDPNSKLELITEGFSWVSPAT